MASLLPFVSELVIMDLGSTDGTLETLYQTLENPKIKIIREPEFPFTDAGVFADLANTLVDWCAYPQVLYFQADEIWHEQLLLLMEQKFQQRQYDLSFWRIQYRDNFQRVKWFPHLVHRVGLKDGTFRFSGDGMTTDRSFDAKICSNYGGSWFPKWGSMDPSSLPVEEMILDVSLVGGFRDNIPDRRAMHAPFWHEPPDIEGRAAEVWLKEAKQNPDWTRHESPFSLPKIMTGLVGKTKYYLRPEILEAIRLDTTRELLGI